MPQHVQQLEVYERNNNNNQENLSKNVSKNGEFCQNMEEGNIYNVENIE